MFRLFSVVVFGIAVIALLWTALWVVVATVEPVTAWVAERTVIGTARVYARAATLGDVRTMAWVMGGVSLVTALAFGAAGAYLRSRSRV